MTRAIDGKRMRRLSSRWTLWLRFGGIFFALLGIAGLVALALGYPGLPGFTYRPSALNVHLVMTVIGSIVIFRFWRLRTVHWDAGHIVIRFGGTGERLPLSQVEVIEETDKAHSTAGRYSLALLTIQRCGNDFFDVYFSHASLERLHEFMVDVNRARAAAGKEPVRFMPLFGS